MTEHRFPNPERADHHGLLAHSDSIDAGIVFSAHSEGVFPWYDSGDPVLWWSPDPRGIIPTDGVHVSRSLRKQLPKYVHEMSEHFNSLHKDFLNRAPLFAVARVRFPFVPLISLTFKKEKPP